MSAPAPASPRALRPRPRTGAAILPLNGARLAPLDLTRAARALDLAACDARDTADRTDQIVHALRKDGGYGLNSRANAVRDHAEGLADGAAWVKRCAALPGLPDLVEAIEKGAHVYVDAAPPAPASVVVRPEQDAARSFHRLVGRAVSGARALFRRAA